jgi:hypothetical protein
MLYFLFLSYSNPVQINSLIKNIRVINNSYLLTSIFYNKYIMQYLKNKIKNSSKNSSENNLENSSENSSENNLENSSENSLENSLENSSENSLENSLENKLENSLENKFKKKLNPYQLFIRENYSKIKEENPLFNSKEIISKLANEWSKNKKIN